MMAATREGRWRSWSQPYGTCVAREMANGADGSIATMVMMGFGAIDRFGGGGVRRVRA